MDKFHQYRYRLGKYSETTIQLRAAEKYEKDLVISVIDHSYHIIINQSPALDASSNNISHLYRYIIHMTPVISILPDILQACKCSWLQNDIILRIQNHLAGV